MKRMTLIGVSMILLLALTAGCAGSPGRIELNVIEHDFGTVPNDKSVSQTFQVRNAGRGELEIAGLSTSCGCTTAEIGDRRLAPGETTDLTVTYDPQAHGGATGDALSRQFQAIRGRCERRDRRSRSGCETSGRGELITTSASVTREFVVPPLGGKHRATP